MVYQRPSSTQGKRETGLRRRGGGGGKFVKMVQKGLRQRVAEGKVTDRLSNVGGDLGQEMVDEGRGRGQRSIGIHT